MAAHVEAQSIPDQLFLKLADLCFAPLLLKPCKTFHSPSQLKREERLMLTVCWKILLHKVLLVIKWPNLGDNLLVIPRKVWKDKQHGGRGWEDPFEA